MKRRLETVKALIHDPDILFLDEPTTGPGHTEQDEDLESSEEINEKRNVTILMTTQYLEEADQVCNRIAIIDHGKLMAVGHSRGAQAEDRHEQHCRGLREQGRPAEGRAGLQEAGPGAAGPCKQGDRAGQGRRGEEVEKLIKALSAAGITDTEHKPARADHRRRLPEADGLVGQGRDGRVRGQEHIQEDEVTIWAC